MGEAMGTDLARKPLSALLRKGFTLTLREVGATGRL